MIPVKSLITDHDPDEGRWGDCMRACIASIMEYPADQVPHFMEIAHTTFEDEEASIEALRLIREWLNASGFEYVEIPFQWDTEMSIEDAAEWMGRYTGDSYGIISGESKRGFNHAVVTHKGKIVHDPTYGEEHGLVGPCTDGFVWYAFIVKL